MLALLWSLFTNVIPFLPFALAVVISFHILRATDMTLDGSFVLGAGIFAHLLTLGVAPLFAVCAALFAGMLAGGMVALIQRGGRVDPLLAGVLATFILVSVNLVLMGRPNISLLSTTTFFSSLVARYGDLAAWLGMCAMIVIVCAPLAWCLRGRLGLRLRGLGENPDLLRRLGYSVEGYRLLGFALTNGLSAYAGVIMAQTNGFADINMGYGMTLTGIGAIILGRQVLMMLRPMASMRLFGEWLSALLGTVLYFSLMIALLRFDVDPIYLKLCLGVMLVFFLRAASMVRTREGAA